MSLAITPNPALPLFSLFNQENRLRSYGLTAESRFQTLGNRYVQRYPVNPTESAVSDETVIPTYQLGIAFGKVIPVTDSTSVSSFSGWLAPGTLPGGSGTAWNRIRPSVIPEEAPPIPKQFQQQASFFSTTEADLPNLLQQSSFQINSPQSSTGWRVTTDGAGGVANVELVLSINPTTQALVALENRPEITTGATFIADPSVTGELNRFFSETSAVTGNLTQASFNKPQLPGLNFFPQNGVNANRPLLQVGFQPEKKERGKLERAEALNPVEKRLFALQPPETQERRLKFPDSSYPIQARFQRPLSLDAKGSGLNRSTTFSEKSTEEILFALRQFAAQETQKALAAKVIADLSKIRDGLMPAPYTMGAPSAESDSFNNSSTQWQQQVQGILTETFASSSGSQGSFLNLFLGGSHTGDGSAESSDKQPQEGEKRFIPSAKKRPLNLVG
jgi:hypothetical protein